MNEAQKKIMIAVAIGLVITFLFPPHAFFLQNGGAIKMGYGFIAKIPDRHSIHMLMLFAEWLGIVVLGGIFYIIANPNSTETGAASEQWHNQKQNTQRECTHLPESEYTKGSTPTYSWLRWVVFVVCCIVLLLIYAEWRNYDHTHGGTALGGFLRGVIIFVPLIALWGWVKRGNKPKPSPEPYQQQPQEPSGDSSVGKWLLWIGAVIGLIWLLSESGDQSIAPSQTSYSSSPAVINSTPPPGQSTPSSTNSANDIALRANDLLNQGRYTEALPLVLQLAEQNNVSWQRLSGTMYGEGLGAAQNINQAFYWYKKAAEQGDADAIAALNKLSKEKNEIPYQVQTQPKQIQQGTRSSVKKLKKANKKRGDLRNCLSLSSNEAIAQCAGQN